MNAILEFGSVNSKGLDLKPEGLTPSKIKITLKGGVPVSRSLRFRITSGITARSKPNGCAKLREKVVEKVLARAPFEAALNPCNTTLNPPQRFLHFASAAHPCYNEDDLRVPLYF